MAGCVGFCECVLIRSSPLWLLPFTMFYTVYEFCLFHFWRDSRRWLLLYLHLEIVFVISGWLRLWIVLSSDAALRSCEMVAARLL